MADIDDILDRYSNQVDRLLLGGRNLESFIRQNRVSEELSNATPFPAVAIPNFTPGLDITGGAPRGSNEVISDLMTLFSNLPSGQPGKNSTPINWSNIYNERAQTRLGEQELLDQRNVVKSQAINEAIGRTQQLKSQQASDLVSSIMQEGQIQAQQEGMSERLLSTIYQTKAQEKSDEARLDWEREELKMDLDNRLETAKIKAKGGLPEGITGVEFRMEPIKGTDQYIIAQGFVDPETGDFTKQKAVGHPQSLPEAQAYVTKLKEQVKQAQKASFTEVTKLQETNKQQLRKLKMVDNAIINIRKGAWTATGKNFLSRVGGLLLDIPNLKDALQSKFPEFSNLVLRTGAYNAAVLGLAIAQLGDFGGNDSQMELIQSINLYGANSNRETALNVLQNARLAFSEIMLENNDRMIKLSTQPETTFFEPTEIPSKPKITRDPDDFNIFQYEDEQ